MIIPRSFPRTEEDDFKLNVAAQLRDNKEAAPVYDTKGQLAGWRIQHQYE
jgi:hypothetical protein